MSTTSQSLAEWLRVSLRSGLLFGRDNEPLDSYGKRIVRVILTEVESSEQSDETLSALKTAVRIIRVWHGMGLSGENEAQAWALYQASPEMTQINDAIAKVDAE